MVGYSPAEILQAEVPATTGIGEERDQPEQGPYRALRHPCPPDRLDGVGGLRRPRHHRTQRCGLGVVVGAPVRRPRHRCFLRIAAVVWVGVRSWIHAWLRRFGVHLGAGQGPVSVGERWNAGVPARLVLPGGLERWCVDPAQVGSEPPAGSRVAPSCGIGLPGTSDAVVIRPIHRLRRAVGL